MTDELNVEFVLLRVVDDAADGAADDAADDAADGAAAAVPPLPVAVIAPLLPAVSMVLFVSSCRVLCYIATLCLKTEDS